MNDIMRYAFIGIMLFLIILWFSIIFDVIKHDREVNNMAQKYFDDISKRIIKVKGGIGK